MVFLLVRNLVGTRFVVTFVHVSGRSTVILDRAVQGSSRLLGETTSLFVVDITAYQAIHTLEHEACVVIVDLGKSEGCVLGSSVSASACLKTTEVASAVLRADAIPITVRASEVGVRDSVPETHAEAIVRRGSGGNRAAVLEVSNQHRFVHDDGVVAVTAGQFDVTRRVTCNFALAVARSNILEGFTRALRKIG